MTNQAANRHCHVTVFLSPDPATSQAIDTAQRLAEGQDAEFSAVYVETPYYRVSGEEERAALHDSILYALRAGAHIEILSGTDPAYLIAEYCKSRRVDQLVLTRPMQRMGPLRLRKSLAVDLMNRLPDVHLVTIPSNSKNRVRALGFEKLTASEVIMQILLIIFVMTIATVVAWLVDSTGSDEALLAPIYLLAVLICSVFSDKWIWPIISSVVAIFLFDVLFASPRGSMAYGQKELTLVFAITFITSIVAGAMAMRLHQESQQAQKSSWRTQTLLETTHLLQETEDTDQLIPEICAKIAMTLGRDVLFYPYDGVHVEEPIIYPANPMYTVEIPGDRVERNALDAAITSRQQSGNHTERVFDARYLYMPWLLDKEVIGVLAVDANENSLLSYEYMILETIIQESAAVLESRIKAEEFERIRRDAESDRLRSNILKGISHDLRTPLTSIIGNVTAADDGKDFMSQEDLARIWRSIKTDSQLLSSMVENLLTAARLDNNTMPIHPQVEVLDDIVEAGIDFPKISNETHPLDIDFDDDMLLVNADHALISQVVTNILLNAIHHTPDGTPIKLRVYEDNGNAVVEVADEGGGISDEEKPAIFDLFYTGNKPTIDSDHYLGLGLFLCKTIIDAHHGAITVRDNQPHGSIFSFSLPLYDLDQAQANAPAPLN